MARICIYCKKTFRNKPSGNIIKDLYNKGITNLTGICILCALRMKQDPDFQNKIKTEFNKANTELINFGKSYIGKDKLKAKAKKVLDKKMINKAETISGEKPPEELLNKINEEIDK
ncbi:MAG TPA: hypothetical protein VMQ58_02030 [Candidatus Saccharimonadales bacterium]|nr:hypothetical protein [Candidatus Saccharimonadales bacterium]